VNKAMIVMKDGGLLKSVFIRTGCFGLSRAKKEAGVWMKKMFLLQ
jgi:hypothetical protein